MVDGWGKMRLGDCCDILDSRRIPLNAEQRDKIPGNIPYYGANGVQGYISEYIFDEDLILVAEDGGYFDEYSTRPIAYRISGKSWVNNHAHILRVRNGTNQDFVYYSVVHKNILSFIKGGTRSKLNQSELRAIEIQVPSSIKEQNSIASILNAVDKAIEKTEEAISKHQRIKMGLVQDILERGIDHNGSIRQAGKHFFRNTELGRIPIEWDICRLSDIGSRQYQYLKTGPFGSNLKGVHWRDEGVPVITIGALGDENFISEELLFVSEEKAKSLQSYSLLDGDILFSRVADVGRSLVVSADEEGWIMSSNLMRMRLDKGKYDPVFLHYNIKYNHLVRKQLSAYVNSSGRAIANSGILNSLVFPKPKLKEQKRILSVFESATKHIVQEKAILSKLNLIKQGLMQDLLTGKVRVTHLLRREAKV